MMWSSRYQCDTRPKVGGLFAGWLSATSPSHGLDVLLKVGRCIESRGKPNRKLNADAANFCWLLDFAVYTTTALRVGKVGLPIEHSSLPICPDFDGRSEPTLTTNTRGSHIFGYQNHCFAATQFHALSARSVEACTVPCPETRDMRWPARIR